MMKFTEGKAVINVPEFEKITSRTEVFYNPHMAYDRELSLAIFKASQKKEVCDAFSGSGIRAILYALEGAHVTANDTNPCAITCIKENAELNNVSLTICNEDANLLLRRGTYDVVDVDPFGSPAYYLDSVVKGLGYDSYLFVTATDIRALCGFSKKAALRKYGVKTVKTPFSKELGVRVLVTAILREGAKYGIGFEVLFSYWKRHYIRVFLHAQHSKTAAFTCMDQVNPVYVCLCGWFSTRTTECCPYCGRETQAITSVYLGPIKCTPFLSTISGHDLVDRGKKELDTPFYYDTHYLASFHGVQPPKVKDLIEALAKRGHAASSTIFCSTAVKSDAPFGEVVKTCRDLQTTP
ncbi:MAG: 50S ribosomal protein L11 methyltransferase [Theionarchaea archaeon]|nr:50S ribosomal protein L11 methyltransferase [Theionarchaea archaeon]MBU7036116.1 50S ribosomal protein L11 methyltransferase [Theionarchaea archaeon]